MPKKSFTYELEYDEEDEDIYCKWTRADDVRALEAYAVKVMERILPKPGPEHSVDHIDRNAFNNRRSNLRWATKAEQRYNQRARRDNASGHTGVFRHEDKRSSEPLVYWRACVQWRDKEGKKQSANKYCDHTEEGFVKAVLWFHERAEEQFGKDWVCPSCRDFDLEFGPKIKTSI